MNYLAHLYLSGNSEELIIGNFIADCVKGNQINNYNEKIKRGILLHRQIDLFTDTHAVVAQSKERLRKDYRKYAGIIVDIFYDHFLAVHWKEFSGMSLMEYANAIYNLLGKNQHLFPEKSKLFYGYMVKNNILNAYGELEGIGMVLYGMSRRSKFKSNMENALTDLKQHYTLFEKEFELFFPSLKEHVQYQQ